jgi:asparagine synthase (glutamine-hydrolysing)
MCGITGFWRSKTLVPSDEKSLQAMMKAIVHRGPDGNGAHLDPDQGLAMGHTRLAIIDLSETGRQPIVSAGGDLVLTVNGEFYDYKVQRAVQACQGERFATKTDSEIAVKLYAQRGLDFVHSLRGEFAIALFDQRNQRLVLARDRFGVRPLFFRITADGVYYGSEAKALLAHPDVPKKLSLRSALHQMMQTMAPGTSAFEGIEALRPGHMLVVERRNGTFEVRSIRYWDMTFPDAKDHDPDPNPQAYADGVTEQLIDAVRVRLEADVPVGCYLSGGIDSCSILGLSTAMQQSAVKAFTISFDHDAYDEASIAREMAATTGADQEILELTAAELYGDSFVQTVVHSERTFYNTLGVAKWHMSRRVRECGFKVVVTGEGSDELFGGYPFFKRDYYRHAAELADAGSFSQQLDRSNRVFTGAILAERAQTHTAMEDLCGFTPSWIQPWMMTLELVRPLFSDAAREELADYDPIVAIAERIDPSQLRGRHPLDKAQYTWIQTMLEGQILNWGGDRVDMANSMESRPPFLDHQLAEYAARIPPSCRIRGSVEKWVLREAMRGVLPRVLYEREKFAFMAPPAHTDLKKMHAIRELTDAHLTPEHIAGLGFFDAQRVQAFLRAIWDEKDGPKAARNDIVLNHLLGLHILHQRLAA